MKIKQNNKVIVVLKINQRLFPFLLIGFLLFLLVDEIWGGSVSTYLNAYYFLAIVVVSGGIFAIAPIQETKETTEHKMMTKRAYIPAIIAGVAGSIIIWYKIQNLSFLSYPIAVICGALIILLSILILQEEIEGNELAE